jgi:hypothetical protein
MMIGGGMMLGFGLLMILGVIGLPIAVIVAVIWGLSVRRGNSKVPAMAQTTPGPSFAQYCSHCGSGLQTGWTHCPKCGAPVEMK